MSESEVNAKWRLLFSDGNITTETMREAQQLLDQLSLESPLRVRLENELSELRRLRGDATALD